MIELTSIQGILVDTTGLFKDFLGSRIFRQPIINIFWYVLNSCRWMIAFGVNILDCVVWFDERFIKTCGEVKADINNGIKLVSNGILHNGI